MHLVITKSNVSVTNLYELYRNVLYSTANILTVIIDAQQVYVCVFYERHHQCRRKCQISITEEIEKQKAQTDECHLSYTLFMNSKSVSLFLPEGTMRPSTTVKPRYAQNSKSFSILNYVSSSSVGWGRPISRLGGASERHPDVVAPHHRQALPHTAV